MRSPAARKLLRDLEKELDASGQATNQQLVWTAADSMVIDQCADMLDRKAELQVMYDEAEKQTAKVRLSGEMRLLEQASSRLIKTLRTELPKIESRRTVMNRHAANVRWGNSA